MCGVIGLISKKGNIDQGIVRRMNDTIKHRGPDSFGFYFGDNIGLGMRRLKIIDLSTGDQPIFNEDESILVFFNGEIYNYQGLRSILLDKNHQFKTKSDTEVLVHGYEEWGIDGLLEKIEGMFVFAIFDKSKKKLFIARDRFGEKPLYYLNNESFFAFSSELKTLLQLDFLKKKINPKALFYYLALHHVPEEETIAKGIYRLRAGHYLSLNIEKFDLKTSKYWELEENPISVSLGDAIAHVQTLVEKSIKDRMIADVPVGVFLSGGIDSSILTGIMSKLNPNLKSFSIGFSERGFDESKYSKKVAEHFNTDHHHFVFSDQEALKTIPEVVKFTDEPVGDQAFLPVFLLSKKASQHVKVVLGGEGADEIFGGYDYYKRFSNSGLKNKLMSLFFQENVEEFLDEQMHTTSSGFPLISGLNDRMNLIDNRYREIVENLIREKRLAIDSSIKKIKDPLRRAQYTDIYTWLIDDLLIKYDRMAMSSSLEGRAPYLDSSLVNFAFNLPESFKIKAGKSKYILREAFKEFLPEEIIKRKKHGFNLPMSQWLKTSLSDSLLETAEFEQEDLIDNKYYRDLINKHISGKEDRGRLLYSIFIYKLWCKENLFS